MVYNLIHNNRLGRQPSPLDVTFDRTADFLLSNFSRHEIEWWTPVVTLKLHLYGMENLTRTCPVITYQMEDQQMKYVTRGCGEVANLVLKANAFSSVSGVSILLLISRYYAIFIETTYTAAMGPLGHSIFLKLFSQGSPF